MTRGRQANTSHLIATNPGEAREQWVTAFTRDRADLGPDHARQVAERAAASYAQPRPVSNLIAALRQGWDSEAHDLEWLADNLPRLDNLRQMAQLRRQQSREIEPLDARYKQAQETRSLATSQAGHSETVIAAETEQNCAALLADWNTQRPLACENARRVLNGPGRLGLKLPAVNRANEALARWSVSWQPIIPTMPTGRTEIASFADRADDTPRIYAAVNDYARRQAEARHPHHQNHAEEAAATDRGVQHARQELRDAHSHHQHQLAYFGRLGLIATPELGLAQIEQQIATTQERLNDTRERISHLEHELATAQPDADGGHLWRPDNSPAMPGQPADAVHAARTNWSAERAAKQQAAQHETAVRIAVARTASQQQRLVTWLRQDLGSGVGRAGHGHDIER